MMDKVYPIVRSRTKAQAIIDAVNKYGKESNKVHAFRIPNSGAYACYCKDGHKIRITTDSGPFLLDGIVIVNNVCININNDATSMITYFSDVDKIISIDIREYNNGEKQ